MYHEAPGISGRTARRRPCCGKEEPKPAAAPATSTAPSPATAAAPAPSTAPAQSDATKEVATSSEPPKVEAAKVDSNKEQQEVGARLAENGPDLEPAFRRQQEEVAGRVHPRIPDAPASALSRQTWTVM